MSVTPDQIAQGILANLKATTNLSCELGTPERKIVDAVAQAISAAYISNYLTGSLLDIETKTGLELDQFVGTFGFGRLQGKAAEGVVTIEVTTPLNQNYTVQKGTRFFTKNATTATNNIYFAAKQDVILTAGTYSINVPVKCTSVGTSGNVPPDSITFMGSMLGSSSCTNLQAMSGGVDIETDAELRYRFENSLLRNVAGTEDWYKALCLQNNSVSRATVYGPVSIYRTQIVAPGNSTTDGTINLNVLRSSRVGAGTDVSYVWPGMESVFVNLKQNNEVFYGRGFDYELTSGATTPQFKRLASGGIQAGDIVDVEFQYTSSASRNNPVKGITNKVDVYVDGSSPVTVTEVTAVTNTFITGSPNSTSPYYTTTTNLQNTENPFYAGNFERVGASGVPQPGNRFTRLNSCPIISFPQSIITNSSAYRRNEHYWILKDTTKKRGSPYEVSGIEWATSANNGVAGPDVTSKIVVDYVYNQTPQILTSTMFAAKQICTDVMVHYADYRYVMPCLNIQYTHGYDVATTNTAINNRLQIFFQALNFGNWVDISKMCLAVQQILGVSSVSLTKQEDPGVGSSGHFGVRVYKNSNDIAFLQETGNFKLEDGQVAQFLSVKIRREATP